MHRIDEPERFAPVSDPRPNDTAWPAMTWPVPVDTALIGEVVQLSALDPARDAAELMQTLNHDHVWAHVPGRPADLAQFQAMLDQRCSLADWQLLFGYAFDTLRVGRIQLKTDTHNHRSQQAIARLDATYEGTLRRSFRRDDGTIRDSLLFSVTADDWPDARHRLTERVYRATGYGRSASAP